MLEFIHEDVTMVTPIDPVDPKPDGGVHEIHGSDKVVTAVFTICSTSALQLSLWHASAVSVACALGQHNVQWSARCVEIGRKSIMWLLQFLAGICLGIGAESGCLPLRASRGLGPVIQPVYSLRVWLWHRC